MTEISFLKNVWLFKPTRDFNQRRESCSEKCDGFDHFKSIIWEETATEFAWQNRILAQVNYWVCIHRRKREQKNMTMGSKMKSSRSIKVSWKNRIWALSFYVLGIEIISLGKSMHYISYNVSIVYNSKWRDSCFVMDMWCVFLTKVRPENSSKMHIM